NKDWLNQRNIIDKLRERKELKQIISMHQNAILKLKNGKNLIFHTDQGWQYQMKQYQQILKQQDITQSMSRKGNCWDNAIIENFFGTLKSELLYLKKFNNIDHLKREIKEYIGYYNNERIKSNLNNMSPVEYGTHYYKTLN